MTANQATEPQTEVKTETPPPRKSQVTPDVQESKSSNNVVSVSLLLLLIAGALSGGGYWIWKKNQLAQQALSQLRTDVDNRIASAANEQNQKMKLVGDQITAVTVNLGELSNRFSGTGRDLVIAEVDYLLQIANYRLQLEHDVKTALLALELADAKLRTLSDPAFFEVRQAIAKDTGILSAIETIDVAGMSLTLSELAAHVTELRLRPLSRINRDEQKSAQTDATPTTFWDKVWLRFWNALTSLLKIRHHEKPIEPLLTPEESIFLSQNLQLKIEQTRLAMIQRDNKLFHQTIDRINDWLRLYYDESNIQTQGFLRKLDAWRRINIAPELPDISYSARVLDKVAKKVGYNLTSKLGSSEKANRPEIAK